MNKLIISSWIIASALLIAPASIAQKKGSYQSKWHPGLAKEQEEELINQMQLDEKSQFLFLVSNDEKDLFIDLVVADRAAIQKIMRYGLTTWFNPEAKHKKAMGIEFPVTSEGKSEPNYMRDKNSDKKEMRMAMMAGKNQEMTLVGFGAKDERKVIDPRNDEAFRGKVEMMEGGRIYISLALPLDKLQRDDPASFANPISVGFETGYMDVTGQGMASGGGQPSGGGMHSGSMYGSGGPPSGGGAPGSMSSSPEQQERPDIGQLASPSKLWIKQVTLAPKP
jgi:uncharacterized membrane protein YgcG